MEPQTSDDDLTFPNNAMEEREYLASVRDGDTQRRLSAVRQLRDETDVIRSCATRLRKVFEILGDDEGMVAAQHIGSYVSVAVDRQQEQLFQHKQRLSDEKRLPAWMKDRV